MSRPKALTDDALREICEWAALPPRKRFRTVAGMATKMRVSVTTIKRAASGKDYYAKDTPRVSRGIDQPWQSHTERKVCRPEALSVASSTGTPEITGVAGSAETRYHRRADPHGETGNAGAVGRGPHFGNER